MNYNESAIVYTVNEVADGMGGYDQERKNIATIKCKEAPYTVREVNSARASSPITFKVEGNLNVVKAVHS